MSPALLSLAQVASDSKKCKQDFIQFSVSVSVNVIIFWVDK